MEIIKHDEEYKICLGEAVTFNTGKKLRQLVVTLILDGALFKLLHRLRL